MHDEAKEQEIAKRFTTSFSQAHPERHVQGRKRILKPKNIGTGRKKKTNSNPTDPKDVSARMRVREFPGQSLEDKAGRLFCNACCVPVATKKSSIKKHIGGSSHEMKIASFTNPAAAGNFIHHYAVKLNNQRRAAGDSFAIKASVLEERMKVAYALLEDGVCFDVLNSSSDTGLRALLQEGRATLPVRALRDTIPDVLSIVDERIKEEMKNCTALHLRCHSPRG